MKRSAKDWVVASQVTYFAVEKPVFKAPAGAERPIVGNQFNIGRAAAVTVETPSPGIRETSNSASQRFPSTNFPTSRKSARSAD
jgi:hypothetical protein